MKKKKVNLPALENIIRNSGVSYKKGPQSWVFNCPKCNKKDKLYISRIDGKFICFFCAEINGFRGYPEHALKELIGIPISDLKESLYDFEIDSTLTLEIWDDDLEDLNSTEEETGVEIPVLSWPSETFPLDHKHSIPGRDYLLNERGVPLDVFMQYDLRYQPKTRSVLFPLKIQDCLVGWQHRIIDPEVLYKNNQSYKRMKTWSSPKLPRNMSVMFSDRIKDHAVICEGPIDALKCHFWGGNVCTMGKIIDKEQIDAIVNAGAKKIYIGIDPDATNEIYSILDKIPGGIETFQIKIPEKYKDLGEIPINDVTNIIKKSEPVNGTTIFTWFKDQHLFND